MAVLASVAAVEPSDGAAAMGCCRSWEELTAVTGIIAKTGLCLRLVTVSRTGVGHPSDTATSALVAGIACEGSSASHWPTLVALAWSHCPSICRKVTFPPVDA